jgi:hypothetical protein
MGVGINSMAALNGVLGVATSKVGVAMDEKLANDRRKISEANDATSNEMAAEKAKLNLEKLKSLKLKLKQQRLKNKDLRAQNKALKERQVLKKEEKPNGKE